MPESTYQWRKVSAGYGEVYIPWNVPVEALSTANRKIAFGQVESAGEVVVVRVINETAGNGVGD